MSEKQVACSKPRDPATLVQSPVLSGAHRQVHQRGQLAATAGMVPQRVGRHGDDAVAERRQVSERQRVCAHAAVGAQRRQCHRVQCAALRASPQQLLARAERDAVDLRLAASCSAGRWRGQWWGPYCVNSVTHRPTCTVCDCGPVCKVLTNNTVA